MNWIEVIVEKERQAHLSFFGKEFDLSEFEEILAKYGKDKVKEWKKLLLEPHFLPKITMDRKADFPGWKVRPDNHAYEVVYQGKVLRKIDGKIKPDKKAHHLFGQTVLIDTRLKPTYQDGKQMYRDDNSFLGSILTELRQVEKISRYEYGKPSSRFGVSADEWENQIKSVLNQDKRFSSLTWRLERGIEGCVIPQLYSHMPRKDNGQTNTWVWYEEYFGVPSHRLHGGDSDYGGLADFLWDWSGGRWGGGSFYPLAVL